MKVAAAVLATVLVAALQACSTGCDGKKIEKAIAFLDTHQACAIDSDCVVVHDACRQIPGGFCGQLAMNRQGANSPEWVSISSELEDCGPDTCSECAAALTPACTNGCCTAGKCGS